MSKWIRARFYVTDEDYRPVKFPPPGPYWCSGFTMDGKSILIAYVRNKNQLDEFWPNFIEESYTTESEIKYSDRFAKPEWYEASSAKEGE